MTGAALDKAQQVKEILAGGDNDDVMYVVVEDYDDSQVGYYGNTRH